MGHDERVGGPKGLEESVASELQESSSRSLPGIDLRIPIPIESQLGEEIDGDGLEYVNAKSVSVSERSFLLMHPHPPYLVQSDPILDPITESLKQQRSVSHVVLDNLLRVPPGTITIVELLRCIPVKNGDPRLNVVTEKTVNEI
jgi:hypothetical protein